MAFQALKAAFGRRGVIGVALLALAALILLSLVSYSPADPVLLLKAGASETVTNWLGPTGALLAEVILQLVGVVGFLIPLVLLQAARRRLRPVPPEGADSTAVRLLILASLAVSATGLASLAQQVFGDQAAAGFAWGGVGGSLLATALSGAMNPLGAGVVLGAIGLMGYAALREWGFGGPALKEHDASHRPGWIRRLFLRLRPTGSPAEDPEVLDPEVEAVVKRPFVVRLPKRRPKPDPEADPAKEPVPVARPPARPDLLKKPAKPGVRPAPGAWKLPSLQLLTRRAHQPAPAKRALEERRKALEAACLEHGVRGQVDRIQPGPVVTTFEFRLGEGETLKKIRNRHEEICMALRAPAIRVERVKGKGVVGIEVPNASPSVVGLREILESSDFQDETGALPVAIGRLVDGRPLVKDLAEMPHLLIAGATGAGKSVQINTLLCSLLTRRTPDELRLILIDPKRVELRPYRGIPHLLTPLILEPDQAKTVLQHACRELDRRTRILEEHGVRNIDGFNRLVEKMAAREARRRRKKDEPEPEIPSPLPRLVIVVDELADLFIHAKAEVTPAIQRLLSLGRAEGIHLVLATQRPSTDIISGTLKANLPTRIAFRVASYVDSRTILDRVGAEMLLGKGDMLMMRPGADLPRAQGAYVDEREVGKLVRFWESAAEPVFDTGMLEEEQPLPFVGPGNGAATSANGAVRGPKGEDSLLPQARELIIREQKASTSMLQTEMGLGYQRARRIVAELERQGVVGPARGAQPRDVLVAPPS
ncbi:MAG: DNA translocase FtsK 4TM domain-containing protein [Acidobacteriota bacterium]|nr:DNA translocase FtsK 4TM domain-containing protein [Acidobacteriota bacterium]